jgi:hypothetical protein
VWKLIDAFKKEESYQQGVYSCVNLGSMPYHSKKRYKQVTKNLTELINAQSQRTTFEFLAGVAMNLTLTK